MARFGKVNSDSGNTMAPIPNGKYNVIVVSCIDKETRYATKFRVVNPGGDHDGAEFYDDFHTSEKALPRLARLARICTGQAVTEADWEFEPEWAIGKTLAVETKNEPKTDKYDERTRINYMRFDAWTPEGDFLAEVQRIREELGMTPDGQWPETAAAGAAGNGSVPF